MASETWAIVDSRDEILARCEEGAEVSDFDFGGIPPYRVVHLVEAGTVDPAVAAVVRAAAEEADKMHHCDCATCSAVRELKLNQLRACGVPVEDSDDAS